MSHNNTRRSTGTQFESLPEMQTSDHKPVRACFDVTLNASGFEKDSFDECGIELEISNIECNDLPPMDADGTVVPLTSSR